MILKPTARETIKQLTTLVELSSLLNSTLDQKEVRRRAMEAVKGLLDCEASSLLLVDEASDELYFEVALGKKGERVKEVRLQMGEGIAGWVARSGEPLLVHDVARDPRHARRVDDHARFTTRNMVCAPVKVRQRVIGVLQGINKSRGVFYRQDLDLLVMLANQVGIAIDHARLYEAIQETFLENAEANKMLGLTFQSKGMLELALERFLRVPLGDEMLEILYHLAWDFERIRNAQKAREVYETIAAKAPGFRDVQGRLKALADPSQAVAGRSSLLRVPAAGQGGAAARQRGAAVGRYEILSELGRGSLGRVYKGRDPRLQRLVALKVLEWEGDVAPEEQQELTRLFLQEVESAGKLNHPGIVVIFDAGEHMGTPYMAMELLEGAPLDRWLCKAKPMPVHHVLHVGLQVSQALSHAHDGGVLHGGIKPSNVFLMPKGRVKVTDFGTASIAARIHAAAEADGRSNQPAYLSPEVVLGEPLDARSDLYSLGALLYAILTGKPPFSDEQVEALMEQIIIRRAVPVRQLNAGVPAPVAALVDRMMSKEPEARFASAGEVAEAIERLLKG